jgi:hypothetical protein
MSESGSIYDGMAHAIQEADAIIVLPCQAYEVLGVDPA